VILALETSCDDTCAAILDGDTLRSSIVSSQDQFHTRYGGVVPEVASRHHLELINPVIAEAFAEAGVNHDEITKVAVTTCPGLIGALMVGVATAKSLAFSWGTELAAVSHIDGHIAANYLPPDAIEPPFICLIASGGHTSIVHVREPGDYTLVGQTLDDAAGEALDKGARLLGLDYPGGAALDRLAATGDSGRFEFPVGLDKPDNFDFSFSGVKTSLYYFLRDGGEALYASSRADIAAGYQHAVITAMVKKTVAAAISQDCRRVCLSGGVSANSELRRQLLDVCKQNSLSLRIPPPELCTDNAAMIASAARFVTPLSRDEMLTLGARATSHDS
jgi:N6-L-threonylcarbamoyladenine synthase